MKARRASGSGVLAVCALVTAACAPAPETDGSDAMRIVSLNPCADAILADIAPGKLAAISHYSHDPGSSSMAPAQAADFPSTSGSAEEVAALAPDLVIASSFLPPATEQAMASMGLKVVKMGSISSVADAKAQVRQLARVAHAEKQGERLVASMETGLASAAPPAGAERLPALVWQAGGLVPGEQTLVSDLLDHTGFTNWSAGRGLGQGAVLPLEDVIADPPPLILVAGPDDDVVDDDTRRLRHPALDALGVEQAAFPARLVYCGGPTIARAVGRLARIRRDHAR
ncbi:ABC transporter substrate-binding protein [Croceicoccus mobilis]|uniref:Cobalamin ABC transporter substrate-binding protein n=1 Tax=Croceicoccus mobilis TaxID=1703339 RepID=A0A917DRR7_9SPHN|nr:helical backbone metal receptor [Croceicoccus mobilis]GGD64751.1 cobalamin ABC transporter substrate-binding protein [Croceicoccus mobilis]